MVGPSCDRSAPNTTARAEVGIRSALFRIVSAIINPPVHKIVGSAYCSAIVKIPFAELLNIVILARMSRADKQLAAMKRSPESEWAVEDVVGTCRTYGIRCVIPVGGEHYVLSHHLVDGLLTLPASRPLKPLHVMLAVDLLEAVVEGKKWYAATKSSLSF